MNLICVGCEYTDESMIAAEVMEWAENTVSGTSHFHAHFALSSSQLTAPAQDSLLTLDP